MKAKSTFLILLASFSLNAEVQTAFDIGTGKIKMQVAKIDKKTNDIQPLFCKACRIEEHTYEHMKILLEKLLDEAKPYSPSVSIGIATEKYRTGSAEANLIARLAKNTGISIEIISAQTEGMLAHKTVTYEKEQDPQKIVVWDIGSGSFQFICCDENKFITYTSPYGRVPFYDFYLSLTGSAEERQQSCRDKGLPFLEAIPEVLLQKIQENDGKVMCIGAYPFGEASLKKDSGQLLVKLVCDTLGISAVNYNRVFAGNTTGLLLHYNGIK